MLLRKPKEEDQARLMDYMMEHYANGEMSISASNGMPTMPYKEWLEKLNDDESGKNEEWGISETYLLLNDNRVVGMLNIRYTLSEDKVEKFGHIGYGVRPSERRKGYATYMLKEALEKCREKNMTEVILGCYEDNIASRKTILNNEGVLYKKSKLKNKNSLYYKVTL